MNFPFKVLGTFFQSQFLKRTFSPRKIIPTPLRIHEYDTFDIHLINFSS